MYRAKTKEGKEVKGGLIKYNGKRLIFSHSIKKPFLARFIKIDPLTLARQIGIQDKNGVEIYGSIPVDGVMSRGGDNLQGIEDVYPVIWDEQRACFDALKDHNRLSPWCWDKCKIIGVQYED